MIKIFSCILSPYKKESFSTMYFKCNKLTFKNNELIFFKGEYFNTFTFYNGFFINKWKQNTIVDNLFLSIKGKGRIKLSIIYAMRGGFKEYLFDSEVDLTDNFTFEIDNYKNYETGCIYFEILPLEDGVLNEAYFSTVTDIPHKVKLGITITHFNRIDAVQDSIERLHNNLFNDETLNKKIFLKLIDNSQNSGVTNTNNIEVIPNKNLGGSGGFTRGLLEMDLDGTYTHCLFMDDDASCEAEAIKRTFYLLSYAKHENLAISGALLIENKPDILWEKGAFVGEGNWIPQKNLLNVGHDPYNLFIADELETLKNPYGGWWFFAFNIKKISFYPFPFFVRGDDISFSLMNQFNIMTMNGITAYGESFREKENFMTKYLDQRSSLVIITFMKMGLKSKLLHIFRSFIRDVLSYNYNSANIILTAVIHYMEGTKFWDENKNMQYIFPIIKKESVSETPMNNVLNYSNLVYRTMHETKFRKIFRILSINGMLIPTFFYKNNTVFQPKTNKANFREVFLFKNICYVTESEQKSYVAKLNKKRFFSLSFKLFKVLFLLCKNNKKIDREYKENLPKMMTKEYWMNIYEKK